MGADEVTKMRAELEEPERPRRTVYWVVFVVSLIVLLCCCLVLFLTAAWFYGDQVVESMSKFSTTAMSL